MDKVDLRTRDLAGLFPDHVENINKLRLLKI